MRNKLQVAVAVIMIVLLILFLRGYWDRWLAGTLHIVFSLVVVFIAIIIFLENRDPSKTVAWLLVLAVFPIIGFVGFIIFGQSYRKRRLFRKRAYLNDDVFTEFKSRRSLTKEEAEKVKGYGQLLQLAHRFGESPVSFSTDSKILTNGEETYDQIFEAIGQAKRHIHLEYYIVRNDVIGNQLKRILLEKVKEGVGVRFLYDAVGSWLLPRGYRTELQEAGVQMVPFFPVKLPFFNHKINFRNHRKIVVVDGNVGFIGGLNIGDEYLGRNRGFGFWRDTHLRLEGGAVRNLQLFFLKDWYHMTGESLLLPEYLSPQPIRRRDLGAVQMIASGPDSEWESIKSLFFSMISSAKKSIWIASPYFIPDEDVLSALRIAALSGLDVRLIVPNRPDKRIVFYASRSYFPELLEAGIEIFEYQKGFMHSKVIVVDGELASIGTANMDMRSFHLNFEVNAFLYRTRSTHELVCDFLRDLEDSTPIHLDQFRKRSFFLRFIESTSRLMSPIL